MFQQLMDTILQGISDVLCYIDDILVTGSNTAEHLQNLTTVFERLENHGVRMERSKCEFLQDSVYYLGHKVDAEGLHAIPSKVDAIVDAPELVYSITMENLFQICPPSSTRSIVYCNKIEGGGPLSVLKPSKMLKWVSYLPKCWFTTILRYQ